MKSGYAQNVVPTSTVQNIVAAAQEKTLHRAQGKFRALEYANNRGTSGKQFDLLAYEWKKVLLIIRPHPLHAGANILLYLLPHLFNDKGLCVLEWFA